MSSMDGDKSSVMTYCITPQSENVRIINLFSVSYSLKQLMASGYYFWWTLRTNVYVPKVKSISMLSLPVSVSRKEN